MFWGLIMEPNKRYTQVVEKPFHISQAAMDISTGDNDACQVMVVVDGKNFLMCTLQKNKTIQVPLDLYFKAGDSISFLTNGKCNIHLTGYLDPEFEDDQMSDEEAEEEEEAPELVPAKNKRKHESNGVEEPSKKAKQNKKAKIAAEESSDESDGDSDQLQKLLEGGDIDSDENDDSFKVNTSGEVDDDDDDDSDEEEDDSAEEEEEAEDDSAEEEDSEQDTTVNTSKEELDTSKLTKSQKKRLKKKQKQQAQKPQVNGVEKDKKEKAAPTKAEKKKELKDDSEKKEKKSLSGGVFIEDLKVGTGPVAKTGKVVQVYYEGKLKSNNKMFDNCNKGPGFKFRLGSKEVISGWDIGVAGMKVGGKRKIVCPPAMAYGAKGSPPVIPPNSTLVFEVELKNVK